MESKTKKQKKSDPFHISTVLPIEDPPSFYRYEVLGDGLCYYRSIVYTIFLKKYGLHLQNGKSVITDQLLFTGETDRKWIGLKQNEVENTLNLWHFNIYTKIDNDVYVKDVMQIVAVLWLKFYIFVAAFSDIDTDRVTLTGITGDVPHFEIVNDWETPLEEFEEKKNGRRKIPSLNFVFDFLYKYLYTTYAKRNKCIVWKNVLSSLFFFFQLPYGEKPFVPNPLKMDSSTKIFNFRDTSKTVENSNIITFTPSFADICEENALNHLKFLVAVRRFQYPYAFGTYCDSIFFSAILKNTNVNDRYAKGVLSFTDSEEGQRKKNVIKNLEDVASKDFIDFLCIYHRALHYWPLLAHT